MGIIAVLPALVALMSGRRRQLSLLKEEVAVLNSLPETATESREAMLAEVNNSVAYYRARQERQVEAYRTFGFPVAWLALVLGALVYDGSITDAATLRIVRQYAGGGLILFGALTALMLLVAGGVERYSRVRSFFLGRKARKAETDLAGQQACDEDLAEEIRATSVQLVSRRRNIERHVAGILEIERAAVASGIEPLPRPEGTERIFKEYEETGTLGSLSIEGLAGARPAVAAAFSVGPDEGQS